MGVHETSEAYRTNVTGRMARDRSGSEYSENMSDATTCSCTTSSIDKCSLRGCGMFQEPFFLHPPGSRPRDGIYINPMSAYIGESAKPKDTESFYLHSPHDLVYTRITRLFSDTGKHRHYERKDETLTEKKDSTGSQVESEKEIKPASTGASFAKPPPPPPPPPPPDREDVVVLLVNAKQNTEAIARDEKKDAVPGETNRDGRTENGPPVSPATNKSDVSCGEHQEPEVPPASSPADTEEIKASQTSHLVNRHMVLPFIPPKFANADSNTLLKPSEYLKSICKASSKNSLSKARSVDNLDIQSRSVYRREIVTGEEEEDEDEEKGEERHQGEGDEEKEGNVGPPPPPLSPLQRSRRIGEDVGAGASGGAGVGGSTDAEHSMSKTPQPLATISIQDLTSIQLRRTTVKMNATKTFSAPPPRSASMTNVSEPFFVQKTDLIAELKRTKDIPGIKKLKVEMAQVEKTQEQNLMSEISKAFSVSNFVDQIPEKDSSGNAIPIWKRQMLARKAAERAKKELEEQIARENEERRQKAIPAWKRQLLAKKDHEEKRLNQVLGPPAVKVDAAGSQKRDVSPSPQRANQLEEKPEPEEKRCDTSLGNRTGNASEIEEEDVAPIIPWRAQLRKTNSKLNILD
ncbi:espin protein forked isoform X5 [Ptiloglossa arizonensis]|uniref:espin protein forked isoform X5 n=1 Tax=Ptiloglossa arizonensis TaxID=3350558 RepID=UPI003FA0D710